MNHFYVLAQPWAVPTLLNDRPRPGVPEDEIVAGALARLEDSRSFTPDQLVRVETELRQAMREAVVIERCAGAGPEVDALALLGQLRQAPAADAGLAEVLP